MFEDYDKEPEENVGIWFYLTIILAGLIVLAGSLFALKYLGVITFPELSSNPVETETSKYSLSTKNREPAKAALNAIGEINSVASVGVNYDQFIRAIQSAKIKFDAAMRDFEAQSPDDEEAQRQLYGVFKCYLDAKEAWDEFIEDGKYNFLVPKAYSIIPKLAATYGFKPSKVGDNKGEYYRDEVLESILAEASRKLSTLNDKIK